MKLNKFGSKKLQLVAVVALAMIASACTVGGDGQAAEDSQQIATQIDDLDFTSDSDSESDTERLALGDFKKDRENASATFGASTGTDDDTTTSSNRSTVTSRDATTTSTTQGVTAPAAPRATTTTARATTTTVKATTTTARATTTTVKATTTTAKPATTVGREAPVARTASVRLFAGNVTVRTTFKCASGSTTSVRYSISSTTGSSNTGSGTVSSRVACVNGEAALTSTIATGVATAEADGSPHEYRINLTYANNTSGANAVPVRSGIFVRTNAANQYPSMNADGWHYFGNN